MFPFWIDLGRLRAFLSYLPSATACLVLHRSFFLLKLRQLLVEQISDCPACTSPDWVEPPLLARSVLTKSQGTIRWVSDSMNLSFFLGICRWVADSIICPLKKKKQQNSFETKLQFANILAKNGTRDSNFMQNFFWPNSSTFISAKVFLLHSRVEIKAFSGPSDPSA